MAELKPCHFETGERLPGIVKRPDFPHGYKYQVVWETEDQEIIICTRLFETRQQAIDAWNKRSSMNKKERKDRNEMIGHFIGYAIFALALPFLTVGYILWWHWCLTIMGK